MALVLLNVGLVWLVLAQAQAEARISLAEQVAATLAVELAPNTATEGRENSWRGVLSSFRESTLDINELYVIDTKLTPLAVARGHPPKTLDAGFRQALYGHDRHISVEDRLSSSARVVVTQPIPPEGRAVAALRVSMPIGGFGPSASRWVWLGVYALFSVLVVGVSGYALFRRRLVLPIQSVREGTERIASGDFDHRLELEASRELMDLTDALNRMAASLADYRHRTGDQVHHLEQANLALARAQEDLLRSARLASVGRLAAGIAHEVGNPLAAVVGYLDLLRDRDTPPEVVEDLVERAAREVGRIHRTIRELLEFARPGGGLSTKVRVEEILEEAIRTLRYQPAFRRVEIAVEGGGLMPEIHVEPDRLHQVLVNLLLNAADAMGGEGRIRVRLAKQEDLVVLSLADSGPGLSAACLEHLFEPFFTTKGPGEGVGLGLATSQGLIERMGGSIEGRNAPEGGAEFILRLPRAPTDDPTLGAEGAGPLKSV